MIVYKWVIKKYNKYYPIINNGAYKPFNNLDLGYYEKGKIISKFINPYNLIENGKKYRQSHFHRTGFHFWTEPQNQQLWRRYNNCMKLCSNKNINCILKCYVRKKDLIKINNIRLIAKKFRILKELKPLKNIKI